MDEVVGTCWIWPRAINGAGYGTSSKGMAHRVAYEAFVKPIPEGHDIHHRCGVRACVNPFHLETMSRRDHLVSNPNGIVGRQIATTHCPQGHPYDEENTYVHRGKRKCKACGEIRQKAKLARVKRFEHNPDKTHCAHGHEFSEENTYLEITKKGWRKRHCRTCIKARSERLSKERMEAKR